MSEYQVALLKTFVQVVLHEAALVAADVAAVDRIEARKRVDFIRRKCDQLLTMLEA